MTESAKAKDLKLEFVYVKVALVYDAPAVQFLRPDSYFGLIAALIERLKPFDLKPETLTYWHGDGTLSQAYVQATMLTNATAKVGFERMDFEKWAMPADLGRALEAGIAVIGVCESSLALRPGLIESDLGLHGLLQGVTPEALMASFTATGLHVGGRTPQNVALTFQFGETDTQVSSGLVLDKSAGVTGGLFLRRRVSWKASGNSAAHASLIEGDLREILSGVGISLVADKQ